MWKNVVSLMQRKTDNEQRAYFSQILNHAADTLGAEIKWSGSFPDNETEVAKLLIHAGKECLANMIRHANGNILYIYAEDLPIDSSIERRTIAYNIESLFDRLYLINIHLLGE